MLRLDLGSAIDYTLSQRRITNARPRIFRHYRMCMHSVDICHFGHMCVRSMSEFRLMGVPL